MANTSVLMFPWEIQLLPSSFPGRGSVSAKYTGKRNCIFLLKEHQQHLKIWQQEGTAKVRTEELLFWAWFFPLPCAWEERSTCSGRSIRGRLTFGIKEIPRAQNIHAEYKVDFHTITRTTLCTQVPVHFLRTAKLPPGDVWAQSTLLISAHNHPVTPLKSFSILNSHYSLSHPLSPLLS